MAFGGETLAVEGGDAAGFLSPVLKGVKAQSGEQARLVVSEDTKDATLFAGLVVIVIKMDHTTAPPG
jgi:hypothetical protein